MDKHLYKLTENVYYMKPYEPTDRPVLGAIVGDNRVLIVDSGNSKAHAELFLSELEKLSPPSTKFAAITHWHWDHSFGIYEMNIPTFAHKLTKDQIEKMSKQDWSDEALDKRVETGEEIEFCSTRIKLELPDRSDLKIGVPDLSFDTYVEVDLGGIKCIIEHVGGDHSEDSTVIFAKEDRVLFLGDCMYRDMYHGEENYTKEKLFPLIDKLLSYDADYYVMAHSEDPLTREEMIDYCNMLKLAGNIVEASEFKRELALEKFEGAIGDKLDEEQVNVIDGFIAGNKKTSFQTFLTGSLRNKE